MIDLYGVYLNFTGLCHKIINGSSEKYRYVEYIWHEFLLFLTQPKTAKKKKEMARDTIYCKIIPARVFFLFAHMLKCTLFMPNTQNNEYFLNTGPAG